MSNQKSRRATRFNKSKFATKATIVKSNTIAIKELFVIINSRELSNKEYNNFDNNLQIRN